MQNIKELIFSEKYRPQKFDDLILEHKDLIVNALKNTNEIPSFIFYSNSPGTGKTSTAKVIAKILDCDFLMLNSSMERGIDTIREKISLFSRTLSLHSQSKKCVFLDEGEGLTPQAMASLKNLIEEYSHNVFFIFSTNDLNKIIEPIRSRCVLVNFDTPDRKLILKRIDDICHLEEVEHTDIILGKLVDYYYPDIRAMIVAIQKAKIENKEIILETEKYLETLEALKRKDIPFVYKIVYENELDLLGFNKWLFQYIFENYNKLVTQYGIPKITQIVLLLAEIEKSYVLGVNLPVIFLANLLEISRIL